MRFVRVFMAALATVAAVLLAACGGGGGGTASTPAASSSLNGGVVKGPVSGATVCVFAITGGAKGARLPVLGGVGATGTVSGDCYVTGADGSYSLILPASASGDVLVESSGGSFCSNESQVVAGACSGGTLVALGSSVLSTVATVQAGGTVTTYATPLTTAAVSAAGGSLSASTFTSQYTTLAGQVIGPNSGITPATRPTATGQPYLAQVATYLQGGGTLASAVGTLRQGSTSFSSTPSDQSPATLNAGLVGNYTLRFFKGSGAGCGSVCSYTEGQDLAFSVQGDGSLVIGGTTTLGSPFYRAFGGHPNTAEVIWLDAAHNLEYALTNNQTGVFSEINVGDAARTSGSSHVPGFVGQFRVASSGTGGTGGTGGSGGTGGTGSLSGLQALQALAGSYAAGRQYRGADVAWVGLTIGSDGSLSFPAGSGPALSAANIASVTNSYLCCGKLVITASVDINADSQVNATDAITLYYDELGALKDIEYPGSGISVIGVNLGPQVALPAASTATIPSTSTVTGDVAGDQSYPIAVTSVSGNAATGFSLVANDPSSGALQKQWTIGISNPAGVAQGVSYYCIHGSRTKEVALQTAPGTLYSSKNGGDCAITITSLSTAVDGTITALSGRFTAVAYQDRRSLAHAVVSGGAFHWSAP